MPQHRLLRRRAADRGGTAGESTRSGVARCPALRMSASRGGGRRGGPPQQGARDRFYDAVGVPPATVVPKFFRTAARGRAARHAGGNRRFHHRDRHEQYRRQFAADGARLFDRSGRQPREGTYHVGHSLQPHARLGTLRQSGRHGQECRYRTVCRRRRTYLGVPRRVRCGERVLPHGGGVYPSLYAGQHSGPGHPAARQLRHGGHPHPASTRPPQPYDCVWRWTSTP